MEMQLSPPEPYPYPPDEERDDTVPPLSPYDEPEPAPDDEPQVPVNG
jgi:hypothetical protein